MLLLVPLATASATVPASDWSVTDVSAVSGTIAVGDFDGDGHDDLLLTAASSGAEEVYEGSAGGLPAQPSYVIDVAATTERHTADLDGDGFDDLVWASGTTLQVIHGSASGLDPASAVTVASPTQVDSVALGDLNGDGFVDVLLAVDNPNGVGNAVVWLPSDASGVGSAPGRVWTGSSTFGTRGLAAVDANGDGYDDLALGGGGPNARDVKVYLGSAGGVAANYWSLVTPPPGQDHLGENLVNAGDLDGDGDEDLVSSVLDTATGTWGFALVRGGPAALGAPVITPGVNGTDPELAPMGDTDLDADDELLVGIPTYDTAGPAVIDRGVAAVLKLAGNHRFTTPAAGDYAMGGAASELCGSTVRSGDFDGDGRRDLVTTSPGAAGQGRVDVHDDVP